MPEPLVAVSCAGDSFGTSVSSSRLRFAAFGTPDAAKPSSGFKASAFSASDFAAASAAT